MSASSAISVSKGRGALSLRGRFPAGSFRLASVEVVYCCAWEGFDSLLSHGSVPRPLRYLQESSCVQSWVPSQVLALLPLVDVPEYQSRSHQLTASTVSIWLKTCSHQKEGAGPMSTPNILLSSVVPSLLCTASLVEPLQRLRWAW